MFFAVLFAFALIHFVPFAVLLDESLAGSLLAVLVFFEESARLQ
jgi:hypothetical protein